MREHPRGSNSSQRLWLVGGFALAAICLYLVFTQLLEMEEQAARRVAAFLSAVTLTAGAVWIRMLVPASGTTSRAKWLAVLNLGVGQVFTGLILLGWVLDVRFLMFSATVGLLGTIVLLFAFDFLTRKQAGHTMQNERGNPS